MRFLDIGDVRALLSGQGLEIGRDLPQVLSNFARLELLSTIGGVWVDATVYPERPLSQWVENEVGEDGFFAFRSPGDDRVLST